MKPIAHLIQTRAVLAGAYRNADPRSFLTHAAVCNEHGYAIRTLCERVLVENLADEYADDPTAPPTCKKCLHRLTKIIRENP